MRLSAKAIIRQIDDGETVLLQDPLRRYLTALFGSLIALCIGGPLLLTEEFGTTLFLIGAGATLIALVGAFGSVLRIFKPFQIAIDADGLTLVGNEDYFHWDDIKTFCVVTGENNERWVGFTTWFDSGENPSARHLWVTLGMRPDVLADFMNEILEARTGATSSSLDEPH